MLDLKFVRSHLEEIRRMMKERGYDLDLSRFETLDRDRRRILSDLE
ncbi:MAG: serine--tRNA ligase, partial [Deltaproteobacteria bacterium]